MCSCTWFLHIQPLNIPQSLCHPQQQVDSTKLTEYPNIYIGTGIWSKGYGLSQGFPLDVLVMTVAAEKIRRHIDQEIRSSKIIVLIADHLALHEGADSESVQKCTFNNKTMLEQAHKALGISTEIVLSSDIAKTAAYATLHAQVSASAKSSSLSGDVKKYVISQSALSRYMHVHERVGIKVGWAHQWSQKRRAKNKNKKSRLFGAGFDEVWFDAWYQQLCNDTLQYIYTKPGWATQGIHCYQRSPYAHTPTKARKHDVRLLLEEQKLEQSPGRKARMLHYHLKKEIATLQNVDKKLVQTYASPDGKHTHVSVSFAALTQDKDTVGDYEYFV